jgi:HAD superfamily hydrolase (TIGR01549 family)
MGQNIKEKFDAILADYDGTILDSMMHIAIITTELYRENGIEVDLHEFICQYIQPFNKLHQHFGLKSITEEDQENYSKRYWEISDQKKFKSEFFPEAIGVLKKLHEQGVQLGIVSAARKEDILSRFKDEGFSDLFDEDHIVGRSDKKVDAIIKFCQKNNLKPERVLMVGDAPSDIEYGKEAGVKTAGFVHKSYPEQVHTRLLARLQVLEPDYIFSDWNEFLDI